MSIYKQRFHQAVTPINKVKLIGGNLEKNEIFFNFSQICWIHLINNPIKTFGHSMSNNVVDD